MLRIVPCPLAEANAFVLLHHRHHGGAVGCKFCVAVESSDREIVGVAIVGRPVARKLDDGFTLEVTRLCTTGNVKNAASCLYAACRRASFALGYRRLVTYTLADYETGTSLVASGWTFSGLSPGRSWSVPSRPRVDKHPLGKKVRWETVQKH